MTNTVKEGKGGGKPKSGQTSDRGVSLFNKRAPKATSFILDYINGLVQKGRQTLAPFCGLNEDER